MARRKPRTTKTTTGLPATFIEAEEAEIEQIVREWRVEREATLTADYIYTFFATFYLQQLREDGPFSPSVVDYARRGHGVADLAVRKFAHEAMRYDRWSELPVEVRAYVTEGVLSGRGALPLVYPARAPQIINDLLRNMLLCLVVIKVPRHWPAVPLLTSKPPRRSAAAICGAVFGVSERTVQRIFAADKGMAWELTKFWETYRADQYGPA
jgi:hypothetical protein